MCSSWFRAYLVGGPSSTSLGFQELVDVADRDRPLADGGGDALDRTTSYVATSSCADRREYTGPCCPTARSRTSAGSTSSIRHRHLSPWRSPSSRKGKNSR